MRKRHTAPAQPLDRNALLMREPVRTNDLRPYPAGIAIHFIQLQGQAEPRLRRVRKGRKRTGDIFPLAGPEPTVVQPAELQANPAVVVDLALSRQHRQGHIPGAWFAIRARLAEALDKLPEHGELVLTSEDGTIARYAAAELRTRRPVKVLAGGTAAWKAAGLPLETGMGPVASEPDDVALSARERPAERERYMREYLAWEIDLVNQIARDTDCRFRLTPVADAVVL